MGFKKQRHPQQLPTCAIEWLGGPRNRVKFFNIILPLCEDREHAFRIASARAALDLTEGEFDRLEADLIKADIPLESIRMRAL